MPFFSPEKNTVYNTNDEETCTFVTVGFAPEAKEDGSIIRVAEELRKGVQAIELCGGFGAEWVSSISAAVGHDIPVGSVMYGPEYRAALLGIMKP